MGIKSPRNRTDNYKMGQEIKEKILEVFYETPEKELSIREISKKSKIPKSTVQKYLQILKKEKLIDKNNIGMQNLYFKIKKINYFVEKLVLCGFIEEIIKKMNPSCIIVFGSVRKGEYVKESDIDLFIESHVKKNIELSKFEKKLKHKIQIFVETDINKLNKNLFNNVVNGIKIFGSFKIK